MRPVWAASPLEAVHFTADVFSRFNFPQQPLFPLCRDTIVDHVGQGIPPLITKVDYLLGFLLGPKRIELVDFLARVFLWHH